MVVDGEKVKRRAVGLEGVEDHNLHFFLFVCMQCVMDFFCFPFSLFFLIIPKYFFLYTYRLMYMIK